MKDLVPSHHSAHIDIGSLGFPGDRAITAGRRDYLAWPSLQFSKTRQQIFRSTENPWETPEINMGALTGHDLDVLVVLDRRSEKLNEENSGTDTTLIKLIP